MWVFKLNKRKFYRSRVQNGMVIIVSNMKLEKVVASLRQNLNDIFSVSPGFTSDKINFSTQ